MNGTIGPSFHILEVAFSVDPPVDLHNVVMHPLESRWIVSVSSDVVDFVSSSSVIL
jgi:hypothetical protein